MRSRSHGQIARFITQAPRRCPPARASCSAPRRSPSTGAHEGCWTACNLASTCPERRPRPRSSASCARRKHSLCPRSWRSCRFADVRDMCGVSGNAPHGHIAMPSRADRCARGWWRARAAVRSCAFVCVCVCVSKGGGGGRGTKARRQDGVSVYRRMRGGAAKQARAGAGECSCVASAPIALWATLTLGVAGVDRARAERVDQVARLRPRPKRKSQWCSSQQQNGRCGHGEWARRGFSGLIGLILAFIHCKVSILRVVRVRSD